MSTQVAKTAVIVNEEVIELGDDVVALVAALLDDERDSTLVEADEETWAVAREVFPSELAPKVDDSGLTEIDR